MRNMSFAMTIPQFLDGIKDVTRRLGWEMLKAGESVQAVEKGQGLKPGESLVSLGVVKVLSIRREPLGAITEEDVAREGYPGKTPAWFIMKFCEAHRGCSPSTLITRIEFQNPHRAVSRSIQRMNP